MSDSDILQVQNTSAARCIIGATRRVWAKGPKWYKRKCNADEPCCVVVTNSRMLTVELYTHRNQTFFPFIYKSVVRIVPLSSDLVPILY